MRRKRRRRRRRRKCYSFNIPMTGTGARRAEGEAGSPFPLTFHLPVARSLQPWRATVTEPRLGQQYRLCAQERRRNGNFQSSDTRPHSSQHYLRAGDGNSKALQQSRLLPSVNKEWPNPLTPAFLHSQEEAVICFDVTAAESSSVCLCSHVEDVSSQAFRRVNFDLYTSKPLTEHCLFNFLNPYFPAHNIRSLLLHVTLYTCYVLLILLHNLTIASLNPPFQVIYTRATSHGLFEQYDVIMLYLMISYEDQWKEPGPVFVYRKQIKKVI